MKNNIKEFIGIAFIVLVMAWLIFSFIEINCQNLGENPSYCSANFFVLMSKIFGLPM